MATEGLDTSPEAVLELLHDLEVQATMNDVRNPTEDFVTRVITALFELFKIDVAKLMQVKERQREPLQLTDSNNPTLVGIINLAVVMSALKSILFIKEFYISDVVLPRPARTRKITKLLLNFALYYRSKTDFMNERLDDVFARSRNIDEMKKKAQFIRDAMKKSDDESGRKKAENKQIDREVKETVTRENLRRKRTADLDSKCMELRKTKEESLIRCQEKEADVKKLQIKTKQLKAMIVTEPESYARSLHELEEQQRQLIEQRATAEAGMQAMKHQLQEFETAYSILERQQARMPQFYEAQKSLIKFGEEDVALKRSIVEVKQSIKVETKFDKADKTVTEQDLEKCKIQCEESLAKAHAGLAKLNAEKKKLERNYSRAESRRLDLSTQIDDTLAKVAQVESETSEFVQQCHSLYNQELEDIDQSHAAVDSQIDLLIKKTGNKQG